MEIRFDTYTAYPDSDIRALRKHSLELPGGKIIDYAQCARNFQQVHGGSGKCVGERDSSEPSITFFTTPLPTRIVFVKGSRLREFFDRENAVRRFRTLCQLLDFGGYTTYDGS